MGRMKRQETNCKELLTTTEGMARSLDGMSKVREGR